MAINAKTRRTIDNHVVNFANMLRQESRRMTIMKDGIDGATDTQLKTLGPAPEDNYIDAEITQLRNWAISIGNVIATIEANEAALIAVGDILPF